MLLHPKKIPCWDSRRRPHAGVPEEAASRGIDGLIVKARIEGARETHEKHEKKSHSKFKTIPMEKSVPVPHSAK
jgi:hypothetical protein